jgi:hypothetical protein
MVVVWQGLLKKGGYFDVVVGGLARDFAGGCVAGSGLWYGRSCPWH